MAQLHVQPTPKEHALLALAMATMRADSAPSCASFARAEALQITWTRSFQGARFALPSRASWLSEALIGNLAMMMAVLAPLVRSYKTLVEVGQRSNGRMAISTIT